MYTAQRTSLETQRSLDTVLSLCKWTHWTKEWCSLSILIWFFQVPQIKIWGKSVKGSGWGGGGLKMVFQKIALGQIPTFWTPFPLKFKWMSSLLAWLASSLSKFQKYLWSKALITCCVILRLVADMTVCLVLVAVLRADSRGTDLKAIRNIFNSK